MTNYYDPKYLRGVIRKIQPARLFFRNNFFTEAVRFPTKQVTFEFAENPRGLLPYANEDKPAPSVKRNGYQAKTFTAPLLSGARVISPATLDMKLAGESPYNSGLSPEDRARELAANDLMELQDQLFRQEEYMCARVKQDGQLIIDGEGMHQVIDYELPFLETPTNANKWTASYDILGKLQKMARELRKQGTNPNQLIVGEGVAELFNTNQAIVDLRRDDYFRIPDPGDLADGIIYLCTLRAPGLNLEVYEYSEYYTDNAGNVLPVIDPGTVIMQSSRERDFMLYGAVTYIDERTREYVTEMTDYVPYVSVETNPPVRRLIVSARALPMPRDVNSWYTLKNAV